MHQGILTHHFQALCAVFCLSNVLEKIYLMFLPDTSMIHSQVIFIRKFYQVKMWSVTR